MINVRRRSRRRRRRRREEEKEEEEEEEEEKEEEVKEEVKEEVEEEEAIFEILRDFLCISSWRVHTADQAVYALCTAHSFCGVSGYVKQVGLLVERPSNDN